MIDNRDRSNTRDSKDYKGRRRGAKDKNCSRKEEKSMKNKEENKNNVNSRPTVLNNLPILPPRSRKLKN